MSRFSRRTLFPREPNALALALSAARAEGRPLLDLTESNPTRVGLPRPPPGLLASPEALDYAPEPLGLPAARAALGAFLGLPPEHLVLSASSSEAYGWLFKLLCEPGDEVLVPAPGYPLFEHLAQLEGVAARPYRLPLAHGFGLDVEELSRALTPRTRAIVVVNPGNPTGHFLQEGELAQLASLCAARGLALVSDEVFAPYAWAGSAEGRVASVAGRALPMPTFCLGGLSKGAGLPGLKLGWLHVGGPEAEREEALARLELVADTFLSVGTPVQQALPALLAHAPAFQRAALARVAQNRAALRAARPAHAAWDLLPAEGGWSAVLRIPREPGEEATCLALLAAGVLVQPGYFYDFSGGAFLVLSLLVEPAVLGAALPLLQRVLASS
ncbi:pyridoxal phosphate-dependent aminotransferase [Aggregicoccus sp. 17bor-14]|uniref:pyridoxal phosphate-dependent aminotransferase n=1 Tax=Myxococcaceae TaxID=31 RepID=UPI0012EF8AE4|nr:pyridoxal phosphate-dependent aminotransferase [Simulacricoccus sp. 17bor-14]MRI92273.1 pyridoxal phosphate-dependent aminotransferase [Aggregicoccus sp. 17bor-14]